MPKHSESPTSPMMSSSSAALDPKPFPKSAIMYVVMAALFCFVIIFFIMTSSSTSYRHPRPFSNLEVIRQVCKATRDPAACQSHLSNSTHVPPEATVLQTVHSALRLASDRHESAVSMVRDILDSSADNKNRSDIASVCLEILGYATHRISSADSALPDGGVEDPRAWLSASLAYQYGCMSGLAKVNDTPLVSTTVEFLNTSTLASAFDVLAMMANYDAFGNSTESWAPPKTEREGFWEPATSAGSSGPTGVPPGLKAKVTVCNGTGCDYTKVQDAVNAAPDNSDSSYVIWIKSGVYEETVRVAFEKKNLVFLGDGMGKTVITGSASVGLDGVTTYNTATVGVLGDGFMASGLTIQNTVGPGGYQAVAFRSDSDLSVIENCEFLGNQDTLYAHSLRQYYKSCRIQGNIDFVFGHSASYFQDCLILVAPRQLEPEKGENNAVTAHGRIDRAQSTGFIFHSCVINGTDSYMALYHKNPSVHKNYLGRPWKEYSRTIFINCTMEALISPDGWMPWSGDFALNTLYYGEYGNTGPGSDTSKRVNWSSLIPADHVNLYTVQNFMKSDRWISASSS